MSDRRLLIVEDDPGLQKQMRWCFEDLTTLTAASLKEAEQAVRKEEPQVITLDLGLPPDPGGTSQGFACLDMIQSLLPQAKVIVITGREERAAALEAIAGGAYDFYQKPIDSTTLQFAVNRAFQLWALEAENRRLSRSVGSSSLEGFITGDPDLLAICQTVQRVAPTEVTVAILGETGTGKEIIARNIHHLSNRADAPFVAINCAAIPENLLESELFGHERGAFTGASSRKIGRIEAASGGTLFLDEIGDMPLPLQAKILRFLQERSFERVGGNSSIEVDIRVISATHNDLEQGMAEGSFRDDLYYRLSEITLALPPLRARGEDPVLLANYFLKEVLNSSARLTSEAVTALRSHGWPGNVRELENRIKRAVVLCDGRTIGPGDLDLNPAQQNDLPLNLKSVRAEAERSAIRRALSHANDNVSEAARLLGISRPTLYNLFDKYGINAEPER